MVDAVARRDGLLQGSETEELADYFGRIARRYRDEGVLPYHPESSPMYDVPGLGPDADDAEFAVFNEAECRRLGTLTAKVAGSETRFPVPRIWVDEPETAAAWEGEVRGLLAEFARLRDLDLPNLRLITFIG